MTHFIQDHVSNGDCEVKFIETEKKLADIYTKPFLKESLKPLMTPNLHEFPEG